MSSAYRISPEAQADLDSIWDYIASDNPAAADQLMDRFEEKFDMLSRQPLLGGPREELAPNLRSFPVGNYVIYYQPCEGEISVEVVRVLHGARDVTAFF